MMLSDIANEDVGQRIRFFRKERSLTQEQLGLEMGAGTALSAKATVAKIEKGQIPGGLRLQKIAEILRCSADILLSGTSRELFEVIRYTVRPLMPLAGPAYNAFRVGRIFLHFAIASRNDRPQSDFVETANRLFYLAENNPEACKRLFAVFPRGNPKYLLASGDFRTLIRSVMQDGGEDPAAYLGYDFAMQAIRMVKERYIRPHGLSLDEHSAHASESGIDSMATDGLQVAVVEYESGGGNKAVEKIDGFKTLPHQVALVRVTGDSMEPLAKHGQHVLVAGLDCLPKAGDLVVCWSRRKGVLFKRLLDKAQDRVTLFDISPISAEPLRMDMDDILAMRVIVGVMFG